MRFTHAIVRPPAAGFEAGLSTAGLGRPDLGRALEQHAAYREALGACGVSVVCLDPDPDHPDATFVEDTAVVGGGQAILTRPGAPSRRGEVARIAGPLGRFFSVFHEISAPGTVDGGDVCVHDGGVLVGISHRTDEAGARQLVSLLGLPAEIIDIRGLPGLLHLKSGITALGDGRFLAVEGLLPAHTGVIRVDPVDTYAANAVRVNDTVLVAAGFPSVRARIEASGLPVVEVAMSEFQKMDGGLSCLSLRF